MDNSRKSPKYMSFDEVIKTYICNDDVVGLREYLETYGDSRDCLKLLLEEGACPYIENKTGKTPLECIEDDQLRREMEEYAIAFSTLHSI